MASIPNLAQSRAPAVPGQGRGTQAANEKGAPWGAPLSVPMHEPESSHLVLELHRGCFQPLGAGNHLHMDALAFLELRYPLARQHRAVDEDILAAGHRDETEALLGIAPLDLSVDLFGWTGRPIEAAIAHRAIHRRPAGAGGASARRLRRARIDGGDLGDLRTFGALPHPRRQGRARFERGMTRRFDDADVQKRFARSVGQFDESEAFLTIEPFHFGLPLGPRRDRPGRFPRRTIK